MRALERERKFDIAEGQRLPDLSAVVVVGAPRRFQLTATYLDTPELLLTRNKITLRRRTGGGDAGWHLKLPSAGGARVEVHAPLRAGRVAARVPRVLRDEIREIVGMAPLVPVAVLRNTRIERDLTTRRGRAIGVLCDDHVRVSSYAGSPSLTGGSGRDGAGSETGSDRDGAGLGTGSGRDGAGSGTGSGRDGAGSGTGSDRDGAGWGDEQAWRELEVEVVDGAAATLAVLDRITESLADQGVSVSQSASKIGRFLAGRVAEAVAREADTDRSLSAGDVIMAYCAEQVGVIQARESDVVADIPDAIHKSRVAVRRLRSALRTGRPVLDRSRSDALRQELAWWAGVLGAPRDAEVVRDRLLAALATLPEEAVEGPIAARLTHELSRGHAAAHRDLVRELSGRRFAALADGLADLIIEPPLHRDAELSADVALPRLIEDALARVEAARRRSDTARSRPKRTHWLHETRKKAKAARYLAESSVGALGEGAKEVAVALEAVTESLGEFQDTVVAVERLRAVRHTAASRGEPTATYDVLIALEREARAAAERRAAEALGAIGRG